MKNKRVRKEMFLKCINQNDLAEILGVNRQEMSIMLKYDLAKSEQDNIIAKIRESAAEE